MAGGINGNMEMNVLLKKQDFFQMVQLIYEEKCHFSLNSCQKAENVVFL